MRPQTRRFGFVDFDAMAVLPSSDDADQFVCRRGNGDNVLVTRADIIAGIAAGNVFKVGTPVDNQIGVWTGDGTIEGTSTLIFDGDDFIVGGAGAIIANNSQGIRVQSPGGAALPNVTATLTIPSILVNQADPNTGLGQQFTDGINIITGGIVGTRWLEGIAGTDHIIILEEMHTGITANVTQSQGQTPLFSSYNEITTVANANDVVTLPAASVGQLCTVINSGANNLQIFPPSGDDLGRGVDTSMTLAAGKSITFRGLNTTNWVITANSDLSNNLGTISVLNANGAALLDETTSATNPTLIPDRSKNDTGIGAIVGLDQLTLIGGGQRCMAVSKVGASPAIAFYEGSPIVLQTGVAVTTAAIHAACVALRLFTA